MAAELIPVSVIIPTRNRAAILRETLESVSDQSIQPARIVVVDASDDAATRTLCVERTPNLATELVWVGSQGHGAAIQRNQGMRECKHSVVGFFDDDVLFERDCIARLWQALQSDACLGGVNAMISNQRYQSPGRASLTVFRLLAGRTEETYAGRVLGPAVNLLPEDRDSLPEVVPVEWLNTTCTLYRYEALPHPPFSKKFTGYSLMEDLSLSLSVSKKWKLANARTARIYHNSQPGSHKSDVAVISEMELVNRHYVMTEVMGKRGFGDYSRLAFWELFQLGISAFQKRGGKAFWRELHGKWLGLCHVFNTRIERN